MPFAPHQLTFERGSEIVAARGESLLAYPRGRHAALRALPFRATVCVPLWNEEPVVERALASLTNQSTHDFAIIIVDNASSDRSHALACAFADHHENAIVYQLGQARGRSTLWSLCLDLAFGAYTKLLEASDYLMPSFLATTMAELDADPDVVLVRSGMAVLREGQLVESPVFAPPRAMTGPSALVHALTTSNFVGPPSTHLIRRGALEARGTRFRSDLSFSAAFELALRLFAVGDFAYVQEPLLVFDEGVQRTFNQCGARCCFRDECEARLSVLRDETLPLPSRTLIRTLSRVSALFEKYAERAEDEGQAAELERDYAAAMTELSALLQRAVHETDRAASSATSEVQRLLATAEREARACHYEVAEAQLRQVLAVRPCHPVALGDLGRLRFARRDLEGARKYFLSALALDPALELAPSEAEAVIA